MLLSGLASPSASQPVPQAGRTEAVPEFFIIDGHTHDPVARGGRSPEQGGLLSLRDNGVSGIILPFPLNPVPPEDLVSRTGREKRMVEEEATRQRIRIQWVRKFEPVLPDSGYCLQILPALEYFEDFLDGRLEILSRLKQAGIRTITLSPQVEKRIMNPSREGSGLNDFGLRIIRQLNELEIFADISHLSDPCRLAVIRASHLPVLASHANFRTVVDSPRNLCDETARELAAKGGLILLTFDREYLCGNGPLAGRSGICALRAHLDHGIRLCGADHLGLGSDFGGSGRNAPSDLHSAACFCKIAEELRISGRSAEVIGKITGRNLAVFYANRSLEENR